MSTISARAKSVELYSGHVPGGQRSYFFSVKRAPKGELFMTISELSARDNTWSTQRILIPAEHLRDLYYGMCDAIKAMRAAESGETPVEPSTAAKPESRSRAQGRAAQKADRKALTRGLR